MSSDNGLILGVIVVIVVVLLFLFNFKQIDLSDRIQFCVFIAFLVTIAIGYLQLREFIGDSQLRQRPYIGYPEISVKYLEENQDQKNNELALLFKFKNGGLSTAKVELINMDLYGIYLSHSRLNDKDDPPKLVNKDMNMSYKEIYKDIVILPNQEIIWSTMFHIISLEGMKYLFDKNLPKMVIAEIGIKYSNIHGKKYFTNSIQRIFWVPSFGQEVATDIIKSNDIDEPLKLDNKEKEALLKKHTVMTGTVESANKVSERQVRAIKPSVNGK